MSTPVASPTKRPAKERFYGTKSEDRLWDYVIIGSGMGGMTSAAMLAKLGHRVLILEQHYVPGGFTHTFKRKKWVWDVGVHAVGEVNDKAVVGRVLQHLTDGRLKWASLGNIYEEFYYPDLRIDFPDNRPQFRDSLHAAFPADGAAIDEYLAQVKMVGSTMRNYYLSRVLPPSWAPVFDRLIAGRAHGLLTQSTKSVLDRISPNERLKTALTAQWGYYGVTPDRSSFAIHALVAKHFWYGGYYPIGGAGKIADELLRTVADAGGWTRIRAEVDHIVVDKGRATGVVLKSDGGEGEHIRARHVISAAGALPTVDRLLPPEIKDQRWARSISNLKPSPCHLCLYLGFKGDIRQAGASAANKWFYETWDPNQFHWDIDDPREKAPILYCSFPSLKDPLHVPGPDELHTGEVVTFVPYEKFAPWADGRWQKRGEDYESFKDRLTARLLDQFLTHMPQLRPYIAHAELSTPLSTEHFTRAAMGAIYGIEPTPERFRTVNLRPRTPVKNLYLSGSDMASVGVIGAMVGGALCAVAAEPRHALPYLQRAMKT